MTTEEKNEIVQAVLQEVRNGSTDVATLESATSLDGILGLPAMLGDKLVNVPMPLLVSKKRFNGLDTDSRADSDPFILLGSFTIADGETIEAFTDRVNAVIDSTFSTDAGLDNSKYCGDMRVITNGIITNVKQYVLSFSDAKYVQVASGLIDVNDSGKLVFHRDKYKKLCRNINRGVPEPWSEYGGALADTLIFDIGTFSNKDAALNYAARAEVAGNKQAALIVFHATGATGKLLQGQIFQQVNGQDVTMQILMWDKKLYRRNVTGATGNEGDVTNAFPFEETGAQKLDYNVNTCKLTMSSYENGKIAEVDLPKATITSAGLLAAADKAQIDRTARTVSIDALDAMLSGKGSSDFAEIMEMLGEWTVTVDFPLGPLVIGRMLMFTDNDRHQVTQELHSNYVETLVGHNDSRVNVLHRAYGLSTGDGSVPVGAFTPWTYVTAPPATTTTDGSMSAADKALLSHILDIGDFASKDAACAYAARAEVAGNKQAALIIFHATGATGAKLEGHILQMVNGENTAMQILLWDKRIYRRNVTGATGREGDATNAFRLEQMGVMKMDYLTAAHQLNLRSYENDTIATVEIPIVSTDRPGLMSYGEYIVFLEMKERIAELERRVDALESAGA